MSKRSQSSSHKGETRTDRKLRWLSGSSMAAAAVLLASAPQPSHAQLILRAPELNMPNPGISAPVSPRPAHDIRISAPQAQLPSNDLRISSPVLQPHVTDIRLDGRISLQPHDASQQFNRSNISLAPHAPIDADPINIDVPMTGLIAPQAFTPVSGQAFQANGTSPTGGVSFTSARTTNLDELQISVSEAIINWTPLDTDAATFGSDGLVNNPIDILPAGRTLRFVSNGLDYTVLNRILPVATADGRPVQFNGNVESFVDLAGTTSGGNIWFYSPGGIIAGATSRFDVGSLVLTTNDIDTTGGLFGSSGEMRFAGVADSSSRVEIVAGAQINALNDRSSYVAMVAPRIVQDGSVNVDGSVAYVAAEQANLTINNGLFDISIGVGTTDANGIVHSGTTTGLSSTPTISSVSGNVTDADAQAIYMVAVPKNDALTMLVGGNIGYQPAASASIVNGNIVLSAGANVATTGNQTDAGFAFDKKAADSNSNIEFQNAAFGSSVSTFATNGIVATTSSVSDSIVANGPTGTQNLLLEARNQIDINARGGGIIGANGNVTLRAGSDGVGGTININADQIGFGDLIISGLIANGNLIVDASASGRDDFFTVRNNGGTGIGQDAVGGNINIDINGGGDLVVGGTAQFNTSAQGGKGEIQNGSAQGGNIILNVSSGTFNVTGTTFFDSEAIDAQNLKIGGNGPGLLGSDSVGGDISLNLSGGAVTTGEIVFSQGATASSGAAAGGAQSNDATAGALDMTVTGGTHVIDNIEVYATAASEGSFDAAGTAISGNASSGGAHFLIDGGSLTISSDLQGELNTFGVTPAASEDRVTITVQNAGSLQVNGEINISTRAFHGSDSVTSTGGGISILADNATLTAGGIFLDTSAQPNDQFFSNDPSEGKDFQAGDINIAARNGGAITAGFSFLDANATGNDTIAGNATGGDILIEANDGSIEFTDFLGVNASGVGGVGGDDDIPDSLGTGRGGAVTFRVQGTSGAMTLSDLDIASDGSISVGGEGGAPRFEGDGGLGFGGDVTFDLLGGTFVADDITVGSNGSGGGGGDLFTVPGPVTNNEAAVLAAPEDLTLAVTPFAGGVSAGDGGDGQGGDVTFNLNGGNATVTNLTISANGFGGDGANGDINYGTAGGSGGRGLGGNTTFNAIAGNLTVTSTLTVAAEGNIQNAAPYGSRGAGGFGYGSDGGNGGDGIGGTATFNLDGSATINASNIVVSTNAEGGYGGSSVSAGSGTIQAGTGGSGGNATGGDAIFNNNAGTLGFGQLSVTSVGTGGTGGDVFGFSTGEADNIAGNGGTGSGGNATININQDDLGSPVYIVDASGFGGDGGDGLDGGNGGAAIGGVAAINVNNASLDPDDPTIIASATGGNGGDGLRDATNDITGNSGDGGSATGGTARLEVTGAGGNIALGFVILEANATGGNGADGFYQFGGGVDGGDGGSGGDATGGTVELIARTGGTISLTSGDFTMTSTGTGGTGANGGNSYDSAAGDAGNGGAGTGGNGRLLAQGGTISGNDLNITTTGQGGDGGTRGYYGAFGTNGAQGTGGAGTGGTGIAEIQEGSPGILAFANVTMDSSGTGGGGPIGGIGAGGRIEIADSSTDPAGLISFDSLTATAFDTAIGTGTGSASALSGGFFVTGDSGAISILGDLTVNVAGNIQYDFDADGQMTVGGNATLTSGQNIFIDHSNNGTPVNSIDVSGNFAATAQGDFISTAGSRINAAGTASVRTGQNATVADIAGVGLVDISAMWDANVTNAAVTGTVTTVTLGAGTFVLGPQLLIQAGHDPMGTPSAVFDPNYNATIDGDVTSAGFITVNAGGSALFATGSSTISDNGLNVQTGDDIIIQTGASLVAGNNAATSPNTTNPFPDTNNLILQAGALTPLSSTPVTPIASIVAAGDIDANDFAVVMSANAIDGLGGTITASSISVDINDAPSNAVIAGSGQSDDNGLLSAQCVEGNVCLGTLNADNLVYIGQASNNDVVQGIIESGTVSANDILVTTRRDIIMGTDGIATVLDASNQFLVESTEGDVDLRDASVASASVLVSAVNGSLLGSGNLDSSNDVGITVGADISAASITAGGQLTTVALVGGASESLYTVPGSINVNSYTQGTAQRFRVEAGNDISFGQITIPDNAIELVAAQSGPGDVFLGNTNGASSIVLQGENVGFLSLDATVSGASGITLTATSGNISGGDAVASSAIDLDATDDIAIGSLSTLQAITLDAGGTIAFADASGAGITINSGQDILFDTINATGTATLTATGGTIGVNNAGADITATGAGQGINLFADNVDVGALTTNSGDILISAAQDIALGSAATGTGTPTAASIGLLAGGNIAATGALRAGEDISIRSLGDVALASVSAGDDILVQADGAITLDSATTSGAGIDLFALSFNTANAGLAGSIAFGSETSPGSNIQLTSGGNVTATAALNAHDDIVVTATGTPTLANAISGGDTSISGAAVSLNNGTIGGNLTIDASAGDIDGTGTVTVGGGIDLDATGNVGFGDLDAQGGIFTVDAGNAINFTSATSADVISMTAGGSISGGDLTAVNALNLDGGNIAIGDASAINISFNSGSNILFDSLASTNGIALTASGGTIGVNSTGGDITVSGLGASLNLVADNVDVGALTTNGGDILISAAQDIALGSAATGTGTPTAASIGLLAGGNIAATGALRAGEDISIRSLGDVALASVSTGDDFLVQADGAITLDDATTSGAGIDLFALVFDTANAGQAGSIAFGSETSPGSNIRLTSGGNVTATGALDASDDIIVSATGTPTLANAISGGNTSITGASVALNNGTIGGDLTLNATAGDVDGSGSVTVGGGIDLDATGDVGFGDLEAQGGSFTVDAGGNISFTSATSSDTIAMAAGGGINGGDLTATNGLDLDGGNIAIGDASAGTISFSSAANILFDSLSSPNAIALTAASGSIGMNSGPGDIDSDGDVDLVARSIDIGDVTSGGSVTADATAGDAGFGTVNANDDITITATGTPILANAISGGNTSITGAAVALNNGAIGGDLTLNATAGDVDATGAVTVGGGIDLDATGNVGFGDLDAQGGSFTVDAGGNISFTSAASSGDMALNAGGGISGSDIDSAGAVAIESGDAITLDTITGGGNLGIVANNASDVTVGSVNSGASIDVSTQGSFAADEVNADQSGTGQVAISADNGITLDNVSGNDIGLTALDGLVNVTNNVDVTNLLTASGTAVSIITQQDMSVAAEATDGDIGLSSAANIDVQQAAATGDIVIAAGGSATISDLAGMSGGSVATPGVISSGGDITIAAVEDILINSQVSAANDLQLTAGGLIDIQASAVGSNIRTVSADMEIGSTGNLGQTDLTGDIQIFSDGTTQMVLGDGTDLTGSFSLKNDEFSRIHSGGDLTLTVVPTSIGGFDMVIQNLNVVVGDNVSGPQSANIGLANSLNLVSGQSITVVGLLDFTNGNADSALNLVADQDLFVDAAGGTIQMTNANREFAGSGSLSVAALNVYAMTSQALADIAGLGAADIELRLADNDGIDLADGLIRADNILMTVTDNLLIQNTGTGTDYAERRGFTAGALSIAGPSTGTANIVINGIVGGITGVDTIPATDIVIGFDAGSTINGCVIIDPSSCVPLPGADGLPAFDPVQDIIEQEVTPKKYVADPFASTPIEIKENPEPVEEPLIDEPVTGAGNEDLWVGGTGQQDDEQEEELEPAE